MNHHIVPLLMEVEKFFEMLVFCPQLLQLVAQEDFINSVVLSSSECRQLYINITKVMHFLFIYGVVYFYTV